MPEQKPKTAFENHFQTCVQLLLVALISWAGLQLVELGQQSAVLEQRMTSQGALLNELRVEIREWGELYYRREEAQRALDAIEGRINGLDNRVTDLESR